VLPSPNGSRLSLAADHTPGHVRVLAGCLRNATAVAGAARRLAADGSIGVIPAGELWPDGSLRFAVEDLLGAGAILDRLDVACSVEAEMARDAYRTAGAGLARTIRLSVSGRELVDGGFPGDVDLALEQDVSTTAPILIAGAYRVDPADDVLS
jgi:2-phosphosulfolactate phosphatase